MEEKKAGNSLENPSNAVVSPQLDKQQKENTAPEVAGASQS